MKTIKTYIFLLAVMLFYSTATRAHFGSKGPYAGSVSCGIANDTIVYLGTIEGGVFFSTKQALTGWSCKPVGLKSGKITALAHTGMGAPTTFSLGIVPFAGTADSGVFRYTGAVGSDLYWQKVNTGLTNLKVKSLIALGTNTLIVGTDGGGVFKTVNNGDNWTASNTGLPVSCVVNGLVKTGNRIYAALKNDLVYASDDNGSTWTAASTPNITDVTALSYNSVSDELMIVNGNGLYVVAASSTTTLIPIYTSAQTGLPGGTTVRSISNNGASWFLATDGGVYQSITGVVNWVAASTNLTTMDVNVVVPVAFSSSRLIAGTNKDGVFKTSAGSISWSLNNSTGFNNLATYAIATYGNLVIITANEKGVFRSIDLAASYQRANAGLIDSLNVTDLKVLGTSLFASTKNAGVFVSADSGKSWTAFNSGLPETYIKKIVKVANTLYAFSSTNNIYQSTGFSWSLVQNGLPGGVAPTSVTAYGNNVLLGTLGNGVFKKVANSWVAANTGLSNLNVTSVTANGNKLFAGTDGSGVFISDTSSFNWTAVAVPSISHTILMGLDGSKVQAMASYGSFVLASYKGGLLATTDNGTTWVAAGNQFNLPSYTNVNHIEFVGAGSASGRVFVTTDNNCVYSNALSEFPLDVKTSVTTTITCNGVCNGAVSVTAYGKTPPYTYAWSNGATTSTASNLCAQTYTVIVSDASTNKDTIVFSLTQPSAIDAGMMASVATSSSANDGSAMAMPSGGLAPYSYLWNNGYTTNALTSLYPGDYSVLITDANGCESVGTVTVDYTVTGIDKINQFAENILVYPNPNNGNFKIELNNTNNEETDISIYDNVGRLLKQIVTMSPIVDVNQFTYAPGLYLIKISNNSKTVFKKVAIQ